MAVCHWRAVSAPPSTSEFSWVIWRLSTSWSTKSTALELKQPVHEDWRLLRWLFGRAFSPRRTKNLKMPKTSKTTGRMYGRYRWCFYCSAYGCFEPWFFPWAARQMPEQGQRWGSTVCHLPLSCPRNSPINEEDHEDSNNEDKLIQDDPIQETGPLAFSRGVTRLERTSFWILLIWS